MPTRHHRVWTRGRVMSIIFFAGVASLALPVVSFAQVVTTEDDRLHESERNRAVQAREARDVEPVRRDEWRHPSELYVAGFGGVHLWARPQ